MTSAESAASLSALTEADAESAVVSDAEDADTEDASEVLLPEVLPLPPAHPLRAATMDTASIIDNTFLFIMILLSLPFHDGVEAK